MSDIDTGTRRDKFKMSNILLKIRKQCPPPCFSKKFELKFEDWAESSKADLPSLQVSIEDFFINHEEEFFICDVTCIIGELGGNLGFFLGGSILLGLDIIFDAIRKITKVNCF